MVSSVSFCWKLRDEDTYAPTTSLDAEKSSTEDLLEFVEATPGSLDCAGKLRSSIKLRVGRGRRCQALPEEGVVDVATSVEANGP